MNTANAITPGIGNPNQYGVSKGTEISAPRVLIGRFLWWRGIHTRGSVCNLTGKSLICVDFNQKFHEWEAPLCRWKRNTTFVIESKLWNLNWESYWINSYLLHNVDVFHKLNDIYMLSLCTSYTVLYKKVVLIYNVVKIHVSWHRYLTFYCSPKFDNQLHHNFKKKKIYI